MLAIIILGVDEYLFENTLVDLLTYGVINKSGVLLMSSCVLVIYNGCVITCKTFFDILGSSSFLAISIAS